MMSLDGRRALVTGGGSGIGRGICHVLGEAGAEVVVADISAAGAAETVRLLRDEGVVADAVVLDVTDSIAISRVRGELETEGRSIDILVNDAAIFEMASLEELEVESWDRMIDVNLKGPFLMMKAFLPGMLEHKWGRIISISSTAAKTPGTLCAHYCAAKKGLIALSQSVALIAAPHVAVNCICPGYVTTPMTSTETRFWHETGRNVSEGAALDQMRAEVPMGRLGTPEDIGNAIRWLCLPDSDYITGQAINVDGGLDFF